MAFVVKDRVKQSTTTTGTGSIVLNGTVSGFQTFANALSDGDTTYYSLFEVSTNNWEVGVGTWTESTTTLARTTILASSNLGSAVNLTAQAEVFIAQPAGKAAFFDPSGDLTLVQDPTSNLQAATKQYVDTIAAAGLHYHDPVRVEQEGNLSATYSNGTAGVGATLTNNSTQAALTIDGVALSLNDRVLIYEQTNGYENGIYTVTNVGSASTNWVLTRATDADSYAPSDPDSLGQGDAFFVLEGAAGAGELYVMNTSGTITFGTTNITFTQVAATAVYSAGTGLTLTGTQFSADGANITNVDAVTLDGIDSSQFLRSDVVDTKTAGNLNFSDNVKAIFGAGSDLQIYHDGSNNRLNVTSGNLYVNLPDTSEFTVTGTQNTAFRVDVDSAVTLYNNGSPKLTTTSTGIDVIGTVTADGLTVDGTGVEVVSVNSTQNGAQINFDSASTSVDWSVGISNSADGDFLIYQSGSGSGDILLYTGGAKRQEINRNGDISFYEDTGTTAKFFWDASAESLAIGTTSPTHTISLESAYPYISFNETDQSQKWVIGGATGNFVIYDDTNAATRLAVDGSGNLLVGTTSSANTTEGLRLKADFSIAGARDGAGILYLNRLTSDGEIARFQKDGSTVGSIGTQGGLLNIGNGDCGLAFSTNNDNIYPTNPSTSTNRDAAIDLGGGTVRFKDLYLSGSLSDGTTSRTVADIVGLTSSQFLRSDANDTATGTITLAAAGFAEQLEINRSSGALYSVIKYSNTVGELGKLGFTQNSDLIVRLGTSTTDNTIWHSGNDGSGSGLDADLLDGQEGSYYLDTSSTAQTKSGALTVSTLSLTGNSVNGRNAYAAQAATVPAAGWYRVASCTSASGRGDFFVHVYTTGGSYTPRSLLIKGRFDWGNLGLLNCAENTQGGYWSDVRITGDGTNAHVEVYFTGSILTGQLGIWCQSIGHDTFFPNSGTLTAGGGTVRDSIDLEGRNNFKGQTHQDGVLYLRGDLETDAPIDFRAQTGTWVRSDQMSDSMGWNTTHGVYIGSDTSGSSQYIYGSGKFYDGSTVRTLFHQGNLIEATSFSGTYPVLFGIDETTGRVFENTNITFDGTTNTLALPALDVSSNIQIGAEVILQESTDRADLLQITSTTSGWAGLQIRNSSNEGRWSFMTDGNQAGIYDDENGDWHIYMIENAGVTLYYDNSAKLATTSGGVAVTGAITATGDITAYFSDERLKDFDGKIEGALDKVSQLNGYYYRENDKAKELGFENDDRQVGVSAQEVEAVLPEVIKPAPVDPEYKTVQYEKLVPLLIEAIKELKEEVRQLKEDKA